jgi:prevent-host-death family protein
MITANISKAKNGLSRYLDAVRKGETVLILDRNRPIAQIQPLTGKYQANYSARIDELTSGGLISCPKETTQSWPLLLETPVSDEAFIGSVDALLEERDSGR